MDETLECLGNPVQKRSQLEQMPSRMLGFTGDAPKRGKRVRWFGREDPDSGDPRSNGPAALGALEHPQLLPATRLYLAGVFPV